MHIWKEVSVEFIKVDQQTGKDQKVSGVFLIDATSYGEAEVTMASIFSSIGDVKAGTTPRIKQIKESSIKDTFRYEDGEFLYKCKVKYAEENEFTGKTKIVTHESLVDADNPRDAYDRMMEESNQLYYGCKVFVAGESNFIDIIPK